MYMIDAKVFLHILLAAFCVAYNNLGFSLK